MQEMSSEEGPEEAYQRCNTELMDRLKSQQRIREPKICRVMRTAAQSFASRFRKIAAAPLIRQCIPR